MKTPREFLFERHRPAETRLDALRKKTVASICDPLRSEKSVSTLAPDRRTSSWAGWLLSLRWHLAGMSAVWLVILFLNADHSPGPVAAMPKEKIPSPRQLLLALMENRRQLLQLIEPSAVKPASLPQRRSEFQPSEAIV